MSRVKNQQLIGVIGDEDTITGILLAGIGDSNEQTKNYYEWTEKTTTDELEDVFKQFTTRSDIAILLICQKAADKIRATISEYKTSTPVLIEIPSKDHPYSPEKDSLMKRVEKLFFS